MRDLDLKQIRYFIFVANLRSFSKAARVLNIAQPALSRHIRSLEHDLKAQLLFRTSRGVEPTEAGLVLLEMGGQILASAEEIRDAVSGTAKTPTGEVTVGMPPSMSMVVAPILMEECARRNPEVSLHIVEGLSDFLGEWLASGKIDVAIMTDPGKVPALDTKELAREEMVLVSSPNTNREGTFIDLRELVDVPLLTSHGFKAIVDGHTKSLGIKLSYTTQLDSIAILEHMVMRGVGEAIMPFAVVRAEAEAGKMVVTRIRNPLITRDLVAAVPARRPPSAAVSALRDLIVEQFTHIDVAPAD